MLRIAQNHRWAVPTPPFSPPPTHRDTTPLSMPLAASFISIFSVPFRLPQPFSCLKSPPQRLAVNQPENHYSDSSCFYFVVTNYLRFRLKLHYSQAYKDAFPKKFVLFWRTRTCLTVFVQITSDNCLNSFGGEGEQLKGKLLFGGEPTWQWPGLDTRRRVVYSARHAVFARVGSWSATKEQFPLSPLSFKVSTWPLRNG